jgi:transposase
METSRATLTQIAQQGQTLGRQSGRIGRCLMGAENRGALARFTETISFSQHLLASPAQVGGRRRMAAHLAQVSLRVGPAQPTGLEREFSGRQFRSSKKRGFGVGNTRKGKGTKWMVVADGKGIPLGSQLASANTAEVSLAEATLEQISVPRAGRGRPQKRPLRVIADRGYDSDALRWRLLERGILLICPHRKGRRQADRNDARTLRRYRKRWKIERTFAWLGNYRRLLVRHENHLLMYRAFFHLACLLITLRFL